MTLTHSNTQSNTYGNTHINKIFIIGLPRTATTSVCLAMLNLGYRTAHTAYTQYTMDEAQVIADTPVFSDYQQLDEQYPKSKFIYLDRDLSLWTPSIQQLLTRMYRNLTRDDGGFNPRLKRCYKQIFTPLTLENIQQTAFLHDCYQRHQAALKAYFQHRSDDLLSIDISHGDSYARLLQFLQIDSGENTQKGFERINMKGKVTAWNKIRHPLKVESTFAGRIEPLA
ncbi:MAG: sulfotransferase family protein [Gammaproteobacteria bacterium]|nr:sulfotransferase family protein [Gammaproteobacteria bacterium]